MPVELMQSRAGPEMLQTGSGLTVRVAAAAVAACALRC